MRLLHINNIVCHHQMPLARCLASILGKTNYRFAATDPPLVDREKMGWDTKSSESWVLRAGENESARAEFERWWDKADVVITVNRDIPRFVDRMRRGKLTFYMSERWWKPPVGMARLLHPRFAWMAYRFCRVAQSPWFHYLPIGGYGASDMRRMTLFHGQIWNWGYFTHVPDPLLPCGKRDGELRILWAGRMLSWKSVDTLIRAFALLRNQDSQAHLTLVGEGPCREELKHLVQKLQIEDSVDFHSSMPVSQVRDQMRNAHVYVLPSNGYEGWGAVLNEAMSEGCAVVASEAAGAAKTMIKDGENGLLFRPGDWRRLGELLCQLSDNEPLRLRLAEAGQKTITEYWSPQIASERLLAVSEALLAGQTPPAYSSGPMARI